MLSSSLPSGLPRNNSNRFWIGCEESLAPFVGGLDDDGLSGFEVIVAFLIVFASDAVRLIGACNNKREVQVYFTRFLVVPGTKIDARVLEFVPVLRHVGEQRVLRQLIGLEDGLRLLKGTDRKA